MAYKKRKRAGYESQTDAEERDMLIKSAFVDSNDPESRERILEKNPNIPRGSAAKLCYDNKPQRLSRGRVLIYLRKQLGLTQIEMAALIGTNRVYYAQAEKGLINISTGALDLWCSRVGARLMIIPF